MLNPTMNRLLQCEVCGRTQRLQARGDLGAPCPCGGAFGLMPLHPLEVEKELRAAQVQLLQTQRAIVALIGHLHDHELVNPRALDAVLRLLDHERISQ